MPVVALVATAVGCGGGTPSGAGPGQAEFDLLTRSGSHPVEARMVETAERELTAACMARAGFPYVVEEPPPVPDSIEEREVDPERLRAIGYGLHDGFDDDGSSTNGPGDGSGGETGDTAGGTANDAYVAALPDDESAAYMTALRGDGGAMREMRFDAGTGVTFPERGCEAESRAELYGTLDAWAATTHAPQFMNLALAKSVTRDPEYLLLIDEWSTCMAGKGFEVESPDAAVEELTAAYEEHGATPGTRDREIATAVADGECALEIRLPSAVLELRHRHAGDLPEEDLDALSRLTTVWAETVERARTRGSAAD
ncbi:hypothetical protein [Streptomyces calidiresistens]|uniref:Uncharacterized protein n=1 Tax=Streptomyces calidiresistens TaxID=1485586 RepID=A0A7W3XWW0_9ACTN|nr:hypothetical protein [Streptomyces calidiresistens]MBB0230152.1 hypothetical protein [Streptomyces calidiresistens]